MKERTNVINNLERALNAGKKMLICNIRRKSVLEKLTTIILEKNCDILLWTIQIDGMEDFLSDEYPKVDRILSQIEMDELISLYHLYEFTDKIIFLSEAQCNYPSLMNFVRLGILSEDEMLEALIYSIAGAD